jgi:hypothetical protein
MSERDRARSKDYYFSQPRPAVARRIENRIAEPADVTFARDTMQPPDLTQAWQMAPPNIQPLSKLGRLLGGNQIAPLPEAEVAKFLADIQAMNRPLTFNERWSAVP